MSEEVKEFGTKTKILLAHLEEENKAIETLHSELSDRVFQMFAEAWHTASVAYLSKHLEDELEGNVSTAEYHLRVQHRDY